MPTTEAIVARRSRRSGRAPKQVREAGRRLRAGPAGEPRRRAARRGISEVCDARVCRCPKPPLSPAQRLELQGKDYDKAEKCLAQAIYFEARNEPARGQQAVAQVVLNRVFSPYYPKDVCSVVYQNAHRHLSCQFTFACDGKPEAINERGAWARANRIAKQTLDAKVWLPEVNKATHYHAAYVRPNWIRDMKVMVRYGLHTFYRPRNWGDGSNEAHWGTAANSVKPSAVAAKPAGRRSRRRKTAPRRAYARYDLGVTPPLAVRTLPLVAAWRAPSRCPNVRARRNREDTTWPNSPGITSICARPIRRRRRSGSRRCWAPRSSAACSKARRASTW